MVTGIHTGAVTVIIIIMVGKYSLPSSSFPANRFIASYSKGLLPILFVPSGLRGVAPFRFFLSRSHFLLYVVLFRV